MPPYRVEFRPETDGDLSGLSPDARERVLERIRWLAGNFEETNPEALKGTHWRGVFKLRVGDYRVLYTANRRQRLLTIHIVGHRREIYR